MYELKKDALYASKKKLSQLTLLDSALKSSGNKGSISNEKT